MQRLGKKKKKLLHLSSTPSSLLISPSLLRCCPHLPPPFTSSCSVHPIYPSDFISLRFFLWATSFIFMPKSFRQNSELSLLALPSLCIRLLLAPASAPPTTLHPFHKCPQNLPTKLSSGDTRVGEVCAFDACVCCAHVGVWGLFVFLFQHMIYSVCLLGCLRESEARVYSQLLCWRIHC